MRSSGPGRAYDAGRSRTGSPVAADSSAAPRPAVAAPRRAWASPRWYVCVALLVISATGLQLLATARGVHFRKEAVPLKKNLAALDWSKLEPDYRQNLTQPEPLDEEALQKLGTEEYLQVLLIDTRRDATDPARLAKVFVTYYTGQPDLVPHVPDECYLAGGYDQLGGTDVSVRVAGVGAPNDQVPVRIVQFQAREGQDRPTVLYFFHANGQYKSSRDGVRLLFARSLLERYAYYAKIEVTFAGETDPLGRRRQANQPESVAALGPMLQKLMPVLLADHLAWERVQSGQVTAGVR